ncbi:hypothetical protein CTEN210_00479 [Chaetoceros tenuissimus]|uniref:Leucine-rich repeat domain-containing protein n=1 Tax=Chaetoceros tenuissimus TaxID=426638 RepID=A0AAD3CF78_9STRA|nr:hypothetical protein CTEN210_00479 [Chaetoceros tenuissimus]
MKIQLVGNLKTVFYDGTKLWEGGMFNGAPVVYNKKERESWERIIVLSGVQVIPHHTFLYCYNIKIVIVADTVIRIEDLAFHSCKNMSWVKLSRNLEYIGVAAFEGCEALISIYIPPSCREICNYAFANCKNLKLLNILGECRLGLFIIVNTKLVELSSFENVYSMEDSYEVNEWLLSNNRSEDYALHRLCSSYEPKLQDMSEIVQEKGMVEFKKPNNVGITPSVYLETNPFTDIGEIEFLRHFIMEMLKE